MILAVKTGPTAHTEPTDHEAIDVDALAAAQTAVYNASEALVEAQALWRCVGTT
jgi:hypothetical protein